MCLNRRKPIAFFVVAIMALFSAMFSSCSADEEITKTPVSNADLSAAKEILQDSVVLNATAMQGTVNKTLLEEGCPLKYYLKWKGDSTLNIQIREFCVGKMPLKIWFTIDVKFMKLNSWDKDEYKGDGWIKFQGNGGQTVYTAIDEDYNDGNGGAGSVTGFLNVKTKEIEFVTNFNVMNMSSDVYLQKLVPSRITTFEEDFAEYERKLAEYKKEHGIS